MRNEADASSHRTLVIAAFATVYIVWGSTYLAIRFAVETIPPFVLGAARFLVAGGFLYLVMRLRGAPRPEGVHWKNALISGALMLGVGNGGVNWAEQRVPSGIAALIVAGTPLWFAVLDWLRPGGTRPTLQTVVGIVVGFSGVAWLIGARGNLTANPLNPAGVGMVLLASFCWAAGSLHARYTPKPDGVFMGIALQMVCGGTVMLVTALLLGEGQRLNVSAISGRSVVAYVYLTLFGSLLAFSAYSWLVKATTPARLSTYAYVNPVIAVVLGAWIGHEALTSRMGWAAAVILLGVIVITVRPTATAPVPVKQKSSRGREALV